MCFQDFQGLYDAITEWIPTQESKNSFFGKVSETIQYLQMIQENVYKLDITCIMSCQMFFHIINFIIIIIIYRPLSG